MGGRPLELHLLGELQLVADGREVTLPASKKTRALLAYLVATGGPHRRQWLCDLLWEGPNDPRGELRWSLAKIRPLLDIGGTIRLETDRSRVAFASPKAVVDLTTVRELLNDIPNASLATLRAAIALFQGEFLDGLDLPACYRFQAWCLAERAALSGLRLAALGALVERLDGSPEEALVQARALVAIDPLSEDGHAHVVRLLGRLGHRREALAEYARAHQVLERELGATPCGALERARRAIAPKSFAPQPWQPEAEKIEAEATTQCRPHGVVPFVGRLTERAEIDRLVSAAAEGRSTPVLLITGEPGIGKSRLLEYLVERMTMTGACCLKGRAFEAEAARPYGVWSDALRALPAGAIPEEARQSLVLLRPDLGPPPAVATDRARLFEAILSLLNHFSRQAPLVMVLDDLQWLDEASSALFHYVVRTLPASNAVLFACAVRPGELEDNPAVARTLRALERDERVLRLPLRVLSATETAELVRAVDPAIDVAAISGESEGHPLFALELARTYREGRHRPGRPLQAVIAQQVDMLDDPCRGLVAWAAAIGRTFGPDLLVRLAGLEMPALLTALEGLERRGIVRAVDADTYDFVHDLVRQAAYQQISQPRRKLMHRQLAQALDERVESEDDLATDLARHAELAGNHALAARACVIGGERSLQLFANAEAAALARRGRAHLDRLPDGPLRRELLIGLFKVELLAAAGPAMRSPPQMVNELVKAVSDAEAAGLHAGAATGHYLLSVLHQERGDTPRARQSTVSAAEAGRGAHRQTLARQLANTARCLIELETEVPRARALLGEAETLLGPAGERVCELQWGCGLLERWEGHNERAAARIECALDLARDVQDRWREYQCLSWLAVIEFERGRYAVTTERCRQLRAVAVELAENEAPVADALEALADLAENGAQAFDRLETALSRLRIVDDKSYLAYALNTAASLYLRRGQLDVAQAFAQEALRAATAMQRHGEVTIAEATLARLGGRCRVGASDRAIRRLSKQAADRDRLNARAQAALDEAAAVVLAAPTLAPTPIREKPR
ncbi:transcriptional activator domain-containing protein [Modicisalibacter ilicicola DSM 19980]|uniref:Transcriptional activator domain-containing protein n=1 Tax=Modicisalibacter ilicicola DSM 19980 TaxID=1121942 RepID=A0A1M5ACK6_9GAMM|nr:AAA family ATPase [Halomonas ilicicola]SHF27989.1 transcriptional activator domain-containing protein [Halomonas ilicicola DSM 19980]